MTVDLIVAEKAPVFAPDLPDIYRHTDPNRLVLLRIGFREHTLRERVKAAGGSWIAGMRAYELRFRTALDLGLRDRILNDRDMDT